MDQQFRYSKGVFHQMQYLFLLPFMVLCLFPAVQSQDAFEIMQTLPERNFYDVKAEIERYFAENPNAKGRKHWGRLSENLESMVYPTGEMQNFEARNMKAYLGLQDTYRQSDQRSSHGTWAPYGPNTISGASMGRINSLDFDPTDSDIMYVSTASGGLWKSINGGAYWFSISPHIPVLAVADIEIDPNDPSTIYLLTGDLYNDARPSIGMLKTTDGGATWSTTGLTFARTDDFYPEKLLMHPTNANIQYVATNKGLLKTTDGWATPLTASDTSFAGTIIFDIEFEPGNPSTMYVSLFSPFPVRKSITSGASWITFSDPILTSILGDKFKVEIATTPDNPSCIYAFGGLGGPVGLLRSLDSGTSWSVRDTNIANLGVQSSYNMSLAVDPDDFNNVVLGQVWTKRSATGGSAGSWSGPTNYVHADVHESQFKDGAIYHCNDGGLFKSTDNGVTFTELSQGMAISEIYQISGTPLAPGFMFAGLQDNGTIRRSTSGSFDFATGNDGTDCKINYLNSNVVYTSSQYANFYRSTNGGNSFSLKTTPEQDTSAFYAPLVMDPVDPDILFYGAISVWRTDDRFNPGSFHDLGQPPGSIHINRMAQAESFRPMLYVSSGAQLWRTSDGFTSSGTATWVSINSDLPDLFITGIVVDPNDESDLYVTYGGYGDGQKVYFSDSWGNPGSWVNITGDLPNVPIKCIAYHDTGVDNDPIYIGTDLGVFYRDNDLGDWVYFSNHLPSVRVNDLYINEASNQIVAGTFGRGMWVSDLYDACDAVVNLNGTDGGSLTYNAQQTISSSVNYVRDYTTHIEYSAGTYIDLELGFRAGEGAFLDAKIGPCPTIYSPLQQAPSSLVAPAFIAHEEHLQKWTAKD